MKKIKILFSIVDVNVGEINIELPYVSNLYSSGSLRGTASSIKDEIHQKIVFANKHELNYKNKETKKEPLINSIISKNIEDFCFKNRYVLNSKISDKDASPETKKILNDLRNIRKPNLYLKIYERDSNNKDIEIINYEINLPKRDFSYVVFDSDEFKKLLFKYEEDIRDIIKTSQSQFESENYLLYCNLNVTEDYHKTRLRVLRLGQDDRARFLDKIVNFKIDGDKDRTDFYSLTKNSKFPNEQPI